MRPDSPRRSSAPAAALRPVLALLLAFAPVVAPGAEEPAGLPALAVGWEYPGRLSAVTAGSPTPIPDPNATREHPIPFRLEVFWAEVEREKGVYDWATVERLVGAFTATGHEPILCLWGGNPIYAPDVLAPPTAKNEAHVKAWEAFVRSAARTFRGKVRFYEIWRNPNVPGIWPGPQAAREYAFLLKRSATVIRGEAGRGTAVITGGLFGADTAFLGRMFAEGVGPYLDMVALRPDPGQSVETQVAAVAGLLAQVSPSTGLWAMGLRPPAGEPEAQIAGMTRAVIEAFRAGARVVTFEAPLGPRGWPERADAIVRLRALFPPGMGLLPQTRAGFSDAAGNALTDVQSVTFFDPDKGLAVVAYMLPAPAPAGAPGTAQVALQARRPGPPLLYDIVAGSESPAEFAAVPGGAAGAAPLGDVPRFLIYREGVGEAVGETVEKGPEEITVSAERGMTAEEIITKHQAVASRQQARLRNYLAKGMVQLHFGIGGSQRIDAAMAGNFYFDPASGQEWEFTDYFVNGNRSPWKQFPELPYIQPEKVATVPLDITFDRSYRYDLAGEETVDGRACWVIAFEPVDAARSLYRGRVWIDRESFNKVRMTAVQTGLSLPFVSSEDRSTFGPVEGPDGEIWLLRRVDGQQIFTVAGRNLSILREVTFEDFAVNSEDFERRRQAAYASPHQMMRDTDRGLRYLVKDDAGERVVKEETDRSYLFGLAGVAWDQSRDGPLPLLGVNYFNYDIRGTGIQTNIFFAGVLAFGNATKSGLGGTKFDLGVDAFGVGVDLTDREFEQGREIEQRDVDRKSQGIFLNLGHPFGEFGKVRASAGVRRVNFSRADDTKAGFVIPADVWEREAELSGTFDRAGWSASASASITSRSDWPFWGRPNGRDFDPDAQVYMRWSASGSKEWYLPYFQKIRGELSWFDGDDLDRFSRYQFGLFGFTGPRMRGFGGSGVRFDQGVIARAGYSFNIGNVVRLDATIDQARVRDLSSAAGHQSHTGFGIGANLPGPWETILQFDAGYALRSDIRAAEGDGEVLFVILKLF